MASCVIEEIDPADDPTRFDDALERVWIGCSRDGTAFLAAAFGFLHRRSSWFKNPEASKALARLLRDTRQGGPRAQGPPSGFLKADGRPSASTNGTSTPSEV